VMTSLLADGSCGRLCGFDSESLARELSLLLNDEDLRCNLGAAAVQRVQQFEYTRGLRGYADGLKRLAEESA